MFHSLSRIGTSVATSEQGPLCKSNLVVCLSHSEEPQSDWPSQKLRVFMCRLTDLGCRFKISGVALTNSRNRDIGAGACKGRLFKRSARGGVEDMKHSTPECLRNLLKTSNRYW